MKTITKLLLTVFLINICQIDVFSQHRVLITDYGYKPGDRKNVIPGIEAALEECSKRDSSILVFPKGRYDFWQDFSARSSNGFQIEDLKNVIIDGGGSEFIFHGNMRIARILRCENVTLRNFSVDWERPYIYQGTYLATTDKYIDVKFDSAEYQYIIEDGLFYLTGEGWKSIPNEQNLYDKNTKEILYKTHDGNNRALFRSKCEEITPGVVRFYGTPDIKPEAGTITTLFAGRYITTGIEINDSKNTILKDLIIYHALSQAVWVTRSENITMDNANILVNEKKGRVFSTIACNAHFINCKGLIKMTNCAHTGAGDDFINVRGAYTKVDSISDDYSILTPRDPVYNQPGDELWFVNPERGQRSETRTIKSKESEIQNGKNIGTKLTFTEPLPKDVKAGDFMENKTWSPNVEITNSRILKKHRARGILVTTPYKVVIENNYFRTAGAAILIEGDMEYWFESGANTDVSIRNNIFEDCLTSGNATGSRSEWGEAIITITPSHRPQDEKSEPYHKNIRIDNNTFKTFDIPLIRARSVRGLTFRNNEIIRTYTFEPYAWQKSSFLLDGCREVNISGNIIDKDYKTRLIEYEHMRLSDIKVDRKQNFTIIPFDVTKYPVYKDRTKKKY